MKKYLLIFSVLLATITTQANAYTLSVDETFCGSVYELSSVTMKARQMGIPPALIMQDVSDETDSSGVLLAELANNIVYRAYQVPRYTTETAQEEAIDSFSTSVFISCISSSNQ